jgi:2'-5' RNA ligase
LRLFVAVDVPDDLRDVIESEVVEPLRDRVPGARWTRPGGRHLTISFLGNVEDERMPQIGEALRRAASEHASFDASFEEVGGFPNLRRPRVVWIGIGRGADAMSALATSVQDELAPLGFEKEDRPFTAHLTLARFPKPRVIEEFPEVTVRLNRFRVNEVVLFRSQLHPKGARYTALERCPLRET